MENPIFEKKNVLVTGGAGFIGSHLCERLLKESKVICIDNFSNSHPENISHLLQYPDFEFINHDINQPIDLESLKELDKFKIKFQGIQEIYHLACPTSPADFEKLKLQSLLANSAAMINTLNLALKYQARYVFTSSSVVYGSVTADKAVFKETDQGIVDQLSSRACYDEGKRFAETCVETYRQLYHLDLKIARVFTTYGPRMRLFQGNPIIDWIVNALDNQSITINGGKGLSTSLCYVSDVVDGLVKLMEANTEVKMVNIGGDQVLNMMEVVKDIVAMTESEAKVTEGEEMVFLTRKGAPDLHYIKEVLGWFPLVRLEDGLRKTIDYVIANKEALNFGQK
jgi:UDP-glucuronate decarboxylase